MFSPHPQRIPLIFIPFIVTIETIRLIRPITLAIRLTANIIAGHLLISLINSSGQTLIIILSIILAVQILLIILEITIAFIQPYVFTIRYKYNYVFRILYRREI